MRNAYHGCSMQNSSSRCFIQINQGIKLFQTALRHIGWPIRMGELLSIPVQLERTTMKITILPDVALSVRLSDCLMIYIENFQMLFVNL